MESFFNQTSQNLNFAASEKFDVRQEISYISALAFEKYNKLQFVEKVSGNIHYELDFIMVDTCQENRLDEPEYAAWNKDGTRFFFLGYVDPIHDLHNFKARWKRWALVLVVLDVANKAILKTYGPDAKNPRWNAEGTEVLFDNRPMEIVDFEDFVAEKAQDYASGLSSTFKKAFNGEAVVEEEYDEDLVPLEFMAGRAVQTELISPNGAFCVRFYSLFTPINEPLRMTFSVFQNYNGNWNPIYDLPDSDYVVEKVDYFTWSNNSHMLSFSVNHLEKVFFFDFFYHKVVQYDVPQDFIECKWRDTVGRCLVIKTSKGVREVSLSFPETPPYIYKPWKDGKTVMLSRMDRKSNEEPFLYKISFLSTEGGTKVAICPDYFVQDSESIKISENGWTTFQAFDANRSKQYLVYCDFKTFGEGNEFKVASWELPLVPERFDWDENKEQPDQSRWQPIIHGHRVIRHQFFDITNLKKIPLLSSDSNMSTSEDEADDGLQLHVNTSDCYKIEQRIKRAGLLKGYEFENLEFIDKSDNQVHYFIPFCMDELPTQVKPDADPVYRMWNQDGTKFFFTGYALPMFESIGLRKQQNRHGHLVVVVDVENRKIMDIYKFEPIKMRWNDAGDKVVFAHPLERHETCLDEVETEQKKQEPFISIFSKVVVCTTQDPDKPGLLRVCVMDSKHKHCYVSLPYYITSEDTIRQKGSIVCFYAPVSSGVLMDYVIRFDIRDIRRSERLVINVWNLHTKPTRYVWDDGAARWWPVIKGEVIHPNRFYYDDIYTESVKIMH